MLKFSVRFTFVILIVLGITGTIFSRDKSSQDIKIQQSTYATSADSINIPAIKWPSNIGFLQTGIINADFSDFGQIGLGFMASGSLDPFSTAPSFETPSLSRNDYLFGGAIWIGAVVGNDTLVSVGADGWERGGELGLENIFIPTVERISYSSDYSLRCQFTDTVTTGTTYDSRADRYHAPLHISIASRSHVWGDDTLANAIFYDYLIDYIGPAEQLDSVYIGFFFDSDVGHSLETQGYFDDISGSIRDKSIAYTIDNDGVPSGYLPDDSSLVKVFAFELLASSFTPEDTNFNWWVSHGTPELDFGPRLKETPEDPFRDFATGGIGTPSGDLNKYYMLSHKEWDYDQVYAGTITQDDSLWLAPDSLNPTGYAKGGDTKFLFSMGPITLVKGKSERIIFATFTADSIQVNPSNISNLPENPDLYNENLNLENLIAVGDGIKQALDIMLDPLTQPTGLKVYDYNKISFDQYCFDDVTGHEVYATPVDVSEFPFPGVIPPWYRPSSPIHIGSSLFEIPLDAIDGLTAVSVAYTSDAGISTLSEPDYIFNKANLQKPIIKADFSSTTQDSIMIEWSLPVNATQADYYKIYKIATNIYFSLVYTKPYYLEGGSDKFTSDSIEVDGVWWYYQSSPEPPYAIVPGEETKFIDYSFDDDYKYYVIAVDENGFESDYAFTRAYLVPERDIDFLIINTQAMEFSTTESTISNYYNELLEDTEMSFDIYAVADSIADSVCSSDSLYYCPDWKLMSKYKYLIVDGSEYSTHYWTREILGYLHFGGNFINFGLLTRLSNLGPIDKPDWYQFIKPINIFFGVDSIFHAGFAYNGPDPIEEGVLGFNIAESVDNRFPSLECDTSRFPLDTSWTTFVNHPTNEPLEVTGFKPKENAVITHRYKSLYPETSLMENLPVGVYNKFDDGITAYDVYTYGFHLYYMHYEQARDLLRSILLSVPTDITEFDNDNLPTKFNLSQNYPNPFNPSTTIEFNLPTRSTVTLNIFNILGQKVKELADEEFAAGNYKVTWDGTNSIGIKVSSGIYLYRIESEDFISAKKMLLLK